MDDNARDRIAERVKNAYAAGYNDGRGATNDDRMAAVAERETDRIIDIARESLLTDGVQAVEDMLRFHHGDFTDIDSIPRISRRTLIDSLNAAFGADDDG